MARAMNTSNDSEPTEQHPGPAPGGPAAPRPFSAGFAWLNTAVSLLRSQAPRLLLLGLLLQLLAGLSQTVGILSVVFFVLVPAFTAGMLQGVHRAAEGERPSAFAIFAAFQGSGRLGSLMLLGLVSLFAIMLTLGFFAAGAVAGLDPELVARIQAGDQSAVMELDPALMQQMLFGMVLGLLLGACLSFFAVPLLWFEGRGLLDALWTGFLTLFRQWRALTALGLGLAALGIPVGLFAGMVLTLQMGGSAPSLLLTVLLMAVVVIYQVLVFTAQYVAFRDVFPPDGDASRLEPPDGASSDDQLVA